MAETRIPFHNQRMIFVFIHYTRVDPERLTTLQQSLEEVVTVAAGVAGAERIPNFGLGLLRRPYEQLIPLSSPKTCYSQHLARLALLPDIEPLDASGLYDGGLDAMLDEALPAAIKAAVLVPDARHRRLRVVVVTWEAASGVMSSLAAALHSGRALHVSSAQVVQVCGGDRSGAARLPVDPVEAPAGVQVIGRVVSGDPDVFTALFKEWLMEEAGAEPHLTLYLNSSHQLLLDACETSVSTALLPAALQSRLGVPLTAARPALAGANGGGSVACCKASAAARVRLCSMSAAWCCGPLLHVLPSASARLSYEQHEHNEQSFQALQRSLQSKEEALVCTLHTAPHAGVSLSPRLMLYPAPHGVLALSCLVPRELQLPQPAMPASPLPVQGQVEEAVEAALGSLPLPSDRDILSYFNTGITAALRAQISGNKRSAGGTPASQAKRVACGRVLPQQQEQLQPQLSASEHRQLNGVQQRKTTPSKPFVHPSQVVSTARMPPVVKKVPVTKPSVFGAAPGYSGANSQNRSFTERLPAASLLRDNFSCKKQGLWREDEASLRPGASSSLRMEHWQTQKDALPLASKSSTQAACSKHLADAPKNIFRFARRDV